MRAAPSGFCSTAASLRDAARGAAAHRAAASLAAWALGRWVALDRETAVGLTLIAIGSGLAAAAGRRGAKRGTRARGSSGSGRRVGAGTLLAVLR